MENKTTTVRANDETVSKVKVAIASTKETVSGFYDLAANKELKERKEGVKNMMKELMEENENLKKRINGQ